MGDGLGNDTHVSLRCAGIGKGEGIGSNDTNEIETVYYDSIMT